MTTTNYKWSRFASNGYEVSSHGDNRFSALFAKLSDGRSIEMHYQCDVKGYCPGGVNWRLGKGRPPLRNCNLFGEYLNLWFEWANCNIPLMLQLSNYHLLTDKFATTEVNQANALATILNLWSAAGRLK